MATPLGTLLAPANGVGDTGFEQSRIMSTKPHTDGVLIGDAQSIAQSGAVALTLTRGGAGLWSLNRNSVGVESYFFRQNLFSLLRLGEAFQFGDFGGPGIGYTKPPFPPKGLAVIDIFALLNIAAVAATSATLALYQSNFTNPSAPTVTTVLAPTAIPFLGPTNTAASVVAIPPDVQAFSVADFSQLAIELAITVPSGSGIGLIGLGAHVAFNYN